MRQNLETNQNKNNKKQILERWKAKKDSMQRGMESERTDGWIVNDKETIMEPPFL
jgi:hypothetical protein